MNIKLKKNKSIRNNSENTYEFRFYKYLIFILLILFSCIITVSNLTSSGQARRLVADEVRTHYSDFFEYEIENNTDGLGSIYDQYSNISGLAIDKLMAINVVYYGQDENRYLEPYMRPYIEKKDLSKEEKKDLYIEVNKEIKKIENGHITKLMVKRFSPYILSIIFITIIMGGIAWVSKLNNKEKIFLGILVFCLGGYICYLSVYNLGTGLLISLAIIGSIFEFTKNIGCNSIKKFRFVFLALIVFVFMFSSNTGRYIAGIGTHNSNDILIVNSLKKSNYAENTSRYQRLGENLFSELKKENLIEINENNDYIDNVMKSEKKITFIDKKSKDVICYIYLYEDIPTYRVVYFENNSNRKLYEGVLNPYMRSMIIKLSGQERHRNKSRVVYNESFKFV